MNFLLFPTAAFIELFVAIVLSISLFTRSGNSIDERLVFRAGIMAVASVSVILYLLLRSVLRGDGVVDKELYRLLTFPLAYFAISLIRVNYRLILRLILVLAFVAGLYNLAEFAFLNSSNSAPVESLIFNQLIFATEGFEVGRAYYPLLGSYYRPLGVFGSPHRTSFIFAIAVIAQYLLNRYKLRTDLTSGYWNAFVYLSLLLFSFVTYGKTGMLITVLLMAIAFENKSKEVGISLVLGVFVASAIFVDSFFHESSPYSSALTADLNAFLHLDLHSQLLGLGFESKEDLILLNFANEQFFIRATAMLGVLLTIVMLNIFVACLPHRKFTKFNVMIVVLGGGMILHVAIFGVYFIAISLCVLILSDYDLVRRRLTAP